jgi:hypothetical protein
MVTRNIICMGCQFEGKVEAVDTIGVVSENEIFKNLGKSTNGYLIFRCPSCGGDIAVDPFKAILRRKMKGYPVKKEGLGFSPRTKTSKQRLLCCDGSCMGVINDQGVCSICGRPYSEEPT